MENKEEPRKVPAGWCEVDDYVARPQPLPEGSLVPLHKHISRTQTQFEDGTVIGVIVPPDEGKPG